VTRRRLRREEFEGSGDVETIDIPHNPVNEQVVIAAACVDDDLRVSLTGKIKPDHFIEAKHQLIWSALSQLTRKKLAFDPATLAHLSGGEVEVDYLCKLIEQRPDVPPNIDYHVDEIFWDYSRAQAVRGPIAQLLHYLRDPRGEPEKIRALSKQVGKAFDSGGSSFLLDPSNLIREQRRDMAERRAGRAVYPYGLEGLDLDENDLPRMIPGAKPKQVTVITAVPGMGKSTFAARLAIGLARQKRKVLFGAWEMEGGMTLELLAIMVLGYSRTDFMSGRFSDEQELEVSTLMEKISGYVSFMDNPFRRRVGERGSNQRNLDIVQQHIDDSGCDIFIADLWKRCLVTDDPSDEEEALYRQQAMVKEANVHAILCQQQRSKDVEQRADKRPTREGIKGSSAWVEIADTIIGLNRPAQWKPSMRDDLLEVYILKQRFGKWPTLIEFDWNPEFGTMTNGREMPIENVDDDAEGSIFSPQRRNKKPRR
jgi:replicative DNA helicase